MANTYTQFNIHIVFAVKGRENLFNDKLSSRLFEYLHGILIHLKQYPLAVGGFRNHVHLFFELHPATSTSDVIEKVKANSSKWINENKFFTGHFEWQRGYGGFSYSRGQRNGIIQYIINQKKHHQTWTFREEYLDILKKFDVDFDEQYLFEFYE